jgi:hypothetical protein
MEGIDVTVTIKRDYVEVPVLLKYAFATHSSARPFVIAGPAFGFGVSSKTEVEASQSSVQAGVEVDNYNDRSFDLGLVFGVGADFAVGRRLLTLDVRYTAGLRSMWEDVDLTSIPYELDEVVYADEMTGEAFDMKHAVISLTAGFVF